MHGSINSMHACCLWSQSLSLKFINFGYYRIVPNFRGAVFLGSFGLDVQSQKFSSRKFRLSAVYVLFTTRNITKFLTRKLILEWFWTKFWIYTVSQFLISSLARRACTLKEFFDECTCNLTCAPFFETFTIEPLINFTYWNVELLTQLLPERRVRIWIYPVHFL